jgi:type II secretory pathway pseudopilin PulG
MNILTKITGTRAQEHKSTRAYGLRSCRNGFILPLVIIVVVILSALATGLIMASFGARLQAIRTKNDTAAMLAAEAGYEKGIFWMSKQSDILGSLQDGSNTGTIDLPGGSCSYTVDFDDYIGAKPVFKITSTGLSGSSTRVVDVAVVQEVTGWVMGKCRVPSGPASSDTNPVYFANGEILDIPIHINNLKDSPDQRDIYIQDGAHPRFLQKVEMGEPQKTPGGSDKYDSIMALFEDGIYFDQPNVRITDEAVVRSKVNRFRDSTNPLYRFTPAGTANVLTPRSDAVQLEFYVDAGVGKVKITNNCTVECNNGGTNDYNIVAGSNPMTYNKYPIYAYHLAPDFETSNIVNIEDTYVRQHFGSKESEPGGQIFVNGNVVIGGNRTPDTNQVVKGKMTVVATGNIWIADAIVVDDADKTLRDVNGMPTKNNPNVLGLIAQRVVKIIDPCLSLGCPNSVSDRIYPTNPAKTHSYRPVADANGVTLGDRVLPHSMIIEAAITVGGGGWGAENVDDPPRGRREKGPGKQDYLVVRGTLSESIRGVVGKVGNDGYLKQYYLDKRLLEGILPGDIWFGGKYVPAPAGWHDYRPAGP